MLDILGALIKKFYSQAFRKKLRAPAPDVYDEARQKTIIEELVHAKEDYVRKFETLKLSVQASHSTPTPQMIGSRAAPAPTEGNVAPTQHTSNTLPATTFHNAPAPQHTFNSFSANTFQNTPASQWPLPNIPASYPIMPMDPVTVQPEKHSSWQLLCHLDNLVKSLVREVYSPEYQIPAEPRLRFNGAIREIHRLEVVIAERREPSKSIDSPIYHHHYSPASSQHEPPIAACKTPLFSNMSQTPPVGNMIAASEDPSRPSWRFEQQSKLPISPKRKRRLEEERRTQRTQIQNLRRTRTSHSLKLPMQRHQALEDQPIVPEPERNDVVDDLVKLWTLVR